MRKISRRSKFLVALAGIVALLVSGGAAWAYWQVTGAGSTSARSATIVELEASGITYPDSPLYPGAKSSIRVTIKNGNSFPILVNRVRPGTSAVSVDQAHAAAGCINSGVSMVNASYTVSWPVGKNSTRSYVLPNGIKMSNASDSACQGAAFSVPLTVSGKSTS